MKIVGYIFLTIQGVLSVFYMAWKIYFWELYVFEASHTIFIVLGVLGCFILYLGIVPINI